MSQRPITRGWAAVVLVAAVALLLSATSEAGAVTVGPRTVAFSGFSWSVKASTGLVGPGPNVFSDSPENVWVDAGGQLHLRITYRNGQWLAAEVVVDRSLGYGTYAFNLASPTGRLDPNVVLGLFTWSDDLAYNHREIDVELARWSDAGATQNAQYAVQPADRVGNLSRFVQPDAPATSHQFAWAPNRVSFASSSGASTVAAWKYSGADVPKPGNERTRINLWLDRGRPPTDGAEVEVVLSQFSFNRR